jgi:peptidoglycan/LPS O-acetylase OafA/YrhL
MNWTWYLANEMQFFLLVPLFVKLYYTKRKVFYIVLGVLMAVCKLIQMIVILVNDLSISYFTYNDEYWTVYYVKPYSRLPVYLIGILAGCSYFSFKREDPENQRIAKVLEAIKFSTAKSVCSQLIGFTMMQLMIILIQIINNQPNNMS